MDSAAAAAAASAVQSSRAWLVGACKVPSAYVCEEILPLLFGGDCFLSEFVSVSDLYLYCFTVQEVML
jgi:hypothetical protein